ncbi:MAG: hypothetical protein HC887_10355 [Desulfobacteraceae bacterium]|nr:hypothetical protein [Desulfobacteraceae bacterium]
MANITQYCDGCSKINASNDCTVYPNPAKLMRWVMIRNSVRMFFQLRQIS